MPLPPEYIADLDKRADAHSSPEDVERKARLETEIFVELSHTKHPIGDPNGWYCIGPRGKLFWVKG